MKKIIVVLVIMLLLTTGCTKVSDLSYSDVINYFSTKASKSNVARTGYKYFLPRGMKVVDSTLFNEVLDDGLYKYYLYVDGVSYLEKISNKYQVNSSAVYSSNIEYAGKFGYIEINLQENAKYLVEIMYNYAKIEVIVDIKNVNEVLISAVSILKSIEYNDNVIANLLGDDVLNFSEEEFDIFDTHSADNNYIQAGDEYERSETEIPDTDLIN